MFFVNYKDIQKQIQDTVKREKKGKKKIWFYSSDYSDNLATDTFTDFTKTFIPLFETLPNAMMEVRTKSTNIS